LRLFQKGWVFVIWMSGFLHLPEVTYVIIFIWLMITGLERLSIDHAIAPKLGPRDDCLG
tara:strand:+ start:2825 stop:3001 length:177 start_codon:yes stop_codon:yes gene_type:complete